MNQLTKVIGRLIGVLIAKGVITEEDIRFIFESVKEGENTP